MKAKLSLEIAQKMYESSDESIREFALLNYPELGINITERVKTFEDACKIKGINPDSEFFTSTVLRKNEVAFRKLEVITEVLNEGKTIEIYNKNAWKHFPYFYNNGGVFSFDCVIDWFSYLIIPAPLLFVDKAIADYSGKQFESLYLEYLLS